MKNGLHSLSPAQKSKLVSALQRAGATADDGLALLGDKEMTRELVRYLHELREASVEEELEAATRTASAKPAIAPQVTAWHEKMPQWWRIPRAQTARVRSTWPGTATPRIPRYFEPQTDTEILVLHNPLPFHKLLGKVKLPEAKKELWAGFPRSDEKLPLSSCALHYDGPTWVALDIGRSDYYTRSDVNYAAGEALSALIQFPEWFNEWKGSVQLRGYDPYGWGSRSVSLTREYTSTRNERLFLTLDRGGITPSVRIVR